MSCLGNIQNQKVDFTPVEAPNTVSKSGAVGKAEIAAGKNPVGKLRGVHRNGTAATAHQANRVSQYLAQAAVSTHPHVPHTAHLADACPAQSKPL